MQYYGGEEGLVLWSWCDNKEMKNRVNNWIRGWV